MSQVLSIVASGMVSAVGLSAPANCAAIRCALDNFQETRFIDQGRRMVACRQRAAGAALARPRQLLKMAARAIDEALRGQPDLDCTELPLLLCVAEGDRPGRCAGLDESFLRDLEGELGRRFHPSSALIAQAGSVARWPAQRAQADPGRLPAGPGGRRRLLRQRPDPGRLRGPRAAADQPELQRLHSRRGRRRRAGRRAAPRGGAAVALHRPRLRRREGHGGARTCRCAPTA